MRTFIAVVVALCVSSAVASATVLVASDVGALARDARTIARGRVVAVQGRATDDHRGIETLVTLDVDAYLKGTLGSTLQFRVPGGELGRYRSIFVGAPQFAIDQQVIVFLASRGPSVPHIIGLSEGVYRVVWSTASSSWVVTPPAALPVATVTPIVRGDPGRQPMALGDFERRIRELAAGVK
jgi:hypothetical protein